MLPKELQMAAGLRCCRCELIMDTAALLQCHEASCYETPPPRKRTRRWNVSLRYCRRTSYHEEFLSVISPPCKRTRRWCVPLTCSASSSFVSLVPRAVAHYRVEPVGRWQPLARQCSEREAHERYEHQMIAFFRLSGGLTDNMKQEPWYIRGLQRQPHDRCGFYSGSLRRMSSADR